MLLAPAIPSDNTRQRIESRQEQQKGNLEDNNLNKTTPESPSLVVSVNGSHGWNNDSHHGSGRQQLMSSISTDSSGNSAYGSSLRHREDDSSCSPTSNSSQASNQSVSVAKIPITMTSGDNHQNNQPIKSQVRVKYNYYDFTGVRHEHSNLDCVPFGVTSPSSSSNTPSSPPSCKSPQTTSDTIHNDGALASVLNNARHFNQSSYENHCLRCKKTVYQMDKLGPLKDFTFYHQNCFKCLECKTKLTLKTYFNNQQSLDDKEVYCYRHCPKTNAGKLDNQSFGIRQALDAPKVFEMPPAFAYLNNSSGISPDFGHNYGGNVSSANDCMAPLGNCASKLAQIYQQSRVDEKISNFLSKRLEYLKPKQELLEMRHRREEDELFVTFKKRLLEEEAMISKQIRDEWQAGIDKLIDKYKGQLMTTISAASANLQNDSCKYSISSHQTNDITTRKHISSSKDGLKNSRSSKSKEKDDEDYSYRQQKKGKDDDDGMMIEYEKMNLEKTLTLKLDKKRGTLRRKLKEFERKATAELVEKQSREMLALISVKLDEFREEQQKKLGADLEQLSHIDALASQLASQLQVSSSPIANPATAGEISSDSKKAFIVQLQQQLTQQQLQQQFNNHNLDHNNSQNLIKAQNAPAIPSGNGNGNGNDKELDKLPLPPPPRVPKTSKYELYSSEKVFSSIDERAINVAREDQQTFTDLVHHLTRYCLTDVEKARAIFRWITVKNLNTMQFDSNVETDTPLGLLRGIKNGSENYHVLFKRLCSYAGLHCVVIKGLSKSAGYKPGVKLEPGKFKNSWNAVYVAGAWRFVQCNWGARHLVSVSALHDNKQILDNGLQDGSSKIKTAKIASSGRQLKATSNSTINQPTGANCPSNINSNARGLIKLDNAMLVGHHRNTRKSSVATNISSPSLTASSSSSTSSSSSAAAIYQAALASSALTNNIKIDDIDGHRNSLHSCNSNHHNHKHYQSHHQSNLLNQTKSMCKENSKRTRNHSSNNVCPDTRQVSSSSSSSSSSSKQLVTQKSSTSKSKDHKHDCDSLKYEYDDHYFLTDPGEFIYEFLPHDSEWQLLKQPINQTEFEELPFVRSQFFKYGLYFVKPNEIRSTLYTDSKGAVSIQIGMPTQLVANLIFHYNLKYFDSEEEYFEGISLKRFVMQSVESISEQNNNLLARSKLLESNIVSFKVHLPEDNCFILEIFANSTTPSEYLHGRRVNFKNICKFKIVSKNLQHSMVPLPNCENGEFGPLRAIRLFGLIPLTHESGVICFRRCKQNSSILEIQFRMTRQLPEFSALLHKNNCNEEELSRLVNITIFDSTIVSICIKFIIDGQYGLDLYAHSLEVTSSSQSSSSTTTNNSKQPEPNLMRTHCCKYLINVSS